MRQITVYSIIHSQFLAHFGKSSACPIVCVCVCEMSYCDWMPKHISGFWNEGYQRGKLLCIRWGSRSAMEMEDPYSESLYLRTGQKAYILQINNSKPMSRHSTTFSSCWTLLVFMPAWTIQYVAYLEQCSEEHSILHLVLLSSAVDMTDRVYTTKRADAGEPSHKKIYHRNYPTFLISHQLKHTDHCFSCRLWAFTDSAW